MCQYLLLNGRRISFQRLVFQLKLGVRSFSSSLDLGFKGFFSLSDQVLDKVEEKTYVGSQKRYGFRGIEYEKEVFEIPKIQIGRMTFSRVPVQKEAKAFHENSSINIRSDESSPPTLGRIGWETCRLGGNLLLDLQNNILAFCDSADTLKAKGYHLEAFTKAPLLSDRGFLEVMAKTNMGSLRCVLDTGSTCNCLHSDMREDLTMHDMIQSFENNYEIQQFTIQNKEFGPVSFHRIPIQLPIHVDAFLGMEFFLKHVVFINFTDHLIYIQQNPLYTEVSSRIGFWAGSKRRKSIKKKRAVLNNTALFFLIDFRQLSIPPKSQFLVRHEALY